MLGSGSTGSFRFLPAEVFGIVGLCAVVGDVVGCTCEKKICRMSDSKCWIISDFRLLGPWTEITLAVIE